jgi:predicted dehydrogenase
MTLGRTPVALIGLGAVSRDIHLPALANHPAANLVAAADPDRSRHAHAARVAPGARLYASADALFVSERPELVIIAAPPQAHRDLCLLALRSGAHVLCEKPFVESLDQADEVMAAAQAAGRHVAVNHQYRYLSIYSETSRRLRRGDFGRLYLMQAQQRMFVTSEQEPGWRGELRRRVLFEFGMHVLDLLSCFFESQPVSVSALMPRVLKGDMTDVLVLMQLVYPQDRVASVTLNRASRGSRRYLDLRLECETAALDISFGGVAESRLGWSSERRRPTFRLSVARGGEAWMESDGRCVRVVRAAQEERPAATAAHITAVLDAVAAGEEPPVSAAYARSLLRTVLAAYASAEQGGALMPIADDRGDSMELLTAGGSFGAH